MLQNKSYRTVPGQQSEHSCLPATGAVRTQHPARSEQAKNQCFVPTPHELHLKNTETVRKVESRLQEIIQVSRTYKILVFPLLNWGVLFAISKS